MKVVFVQTKLIDSKNLIESNERQLHSNKAYWIKWKLSAFKKSYLIQLKTIFTQTNLLDSNLTYWNEWKQSAFKQT